jgi:hypothetical protein
MVYDPVVSGRARDLDGTGDRTVADGAPWAVALNSTASNDDVTVTLLALAVVDDVIRVSGVVRVVGRPNALLSSIPTLSLATLDGPPLGMLRAHGLPSGQRVWVSWTFERPAAVARDYEGRIDQFDLAYRAGRFVKEAVTGPWVFTFSVPDGSPSGARPCRGPSTGEAS